MAAASLLRHLGIFIVLVVLQQPSMVELRSLKPTSEPSLYSQQALEGTETHEDVARVRKYLEVFGYLNNSNRDNNHNSNLVESDGDLESALKNFQQYYHLNVSGRPDYETMAKMSGARCGVPDDFSTKFNNSKFNFFQGLPRWPDNMTHLTYTFKSGLEIETLETMRTVFGVAFAQWSNVTSFTFEEDVTNGTTQKPNIVIGFFRGDHGDGSPFDGPGNTLAHAFAPTDGRLHFDADENWSINVPPQPNQYDLIWVAIHEVGHVLGLAHTPDENAVMYPYMTPGVNKRALSEDDIKGIRALYDLPNMHYSASAALQWDCFWLAMFTISSSLFISLFP